MPKVSFLSGMEPMTDVHAAVRSRRVAAAVVCSLGGTAFGYDLGALSGATRGLAHAYVLMPGSLGLTVSISLWGAVCASLAAGRLADMLGRRRLIAGCAFVYALVSFALAAPVALPWAAVAGLRFVAGMSIGGFVVGCPLYLAEIAPRALRGRFVGLFQLQIGAGVLLAFAVSAMVARSVAETAAWKWCLGLGAVPAASLLALLHWLPEEPHWLARRGRQRDANESAERLGFAPEEWTGESGATSAAPTAAQERLFQRKYLRLVLLATSVALFNQLCGVTILRVYLLDLLSGSGMGHLTSHVCAVVVSCLNLVTLALGMMLVDRVGRRPLLMWGSAGMAVCLCALGLAAGRHAGVWFYLGILVAYNTFFSFSQGAAAWVYLSELFPFAVRGRGQGYGALVHWVTNAGLVGIFPVLQAAAPRGSFELLAVLMVAQVAIVLRWYPETKGTRLGEMAEAAPLAPR
jgi:sugar porter (SP) family MFS transporter